jgi:small lipoprotein (TIGR04452 family)
MKTLKLLIVTIIIIIIFIGCPITNKFFLKPSRVKGIEAKQILNNRLASFFVKDISDSNGTSIAGDYLMPVIAGISDDSVYSRREIEHCASIILLAGIAIDRPQIATKSPSNPNSRYTPPTLCQLKPINDLIDLK